jgi:hydrogenase maturation protein HypF
MHKRFLIEVAGIVQGVGFRPYIFRLADRLKLSGFVNNNSDGVLIEIEGDQDTLNEFVSILKFQPPPLAQMTRIDVREIPKKEQSQFQILQSKVFQQKNTLISPDISICEDCSRELLDPKDRRYLYPFINCTNCGPRYTIISDIPYDRPKTSMSVFTMCKPCQQEYDDPLNRRFHAQPNACPDCGPSLEFIDRNSESDVMEPIKNLHKALESGQIAALKGVGGFHLVVDAKNNTAVKNLRLRKHRFEKPLALMVKDLLTAQKYAFINEIEALQLSSLQRPIVLCRKRENNGLSPNISAENEYFGLMLPYSPLHEIIFCTGNLEVLVMTSANISEEPICYENDECLEKMKHIADCYLLHTREIYIRCDDSVMQIMEEKPLFVRRSRGYSPRPIILSKPGKSVLAVGSHLKNTICLTKDNFAFLSQHIGDLENLQTLNAFEHSIHHLQNMFEVEPELIVHDLHPEYLSTKWVQENSQVEAKPLQHHYAHILSVMAENNIEDDIIGFAMDGTGYGADGKIWGGEVLTCNLNSYRRMAHFDYLPMPGGGKAILEPWRMAVSYLKKYFDDGSELANLFFTDRMDQIKIISQAIEKNINAPHTSSCGRLFDAIAAILGIKETVAYEGQAAIMLEALAMQASKEMPDIGEFKLVENDGHYLIDPHEILCKIVIFRKEKSDISGISRAFHEALINVFTQIASIIRSETGIKQVALSGGCFQNIYLLSGLIQNLKINQFQVLTNSQVPVNDGGIALGQAYWGMHN